MSKIIDSLRADLVTLHAHGAIEASTVHNFDRLCQRVAQPREATTRVEALFGSERIMGHCTHPSRTTARSEFINRPTTLGRRLTDGENAMEANTTSAHLQDVVDYIIGQFADEDGSLSILKLQKLLYYVQAWHLASGQGPLFAGRFQAWVHGPVNRQVYDRFKDTHSLFATVGQRDIRPDFNPQALPQSARDHIDHVLEAYGPFSGVQLENMTHDEAPWLEARGGLKPFERCENELSESTMQAFYAKLLADDDKAAH